MTGTFHSEVLTITKQARAYPVPDARSVPSIEDGILVDPVVDTTDIWIRYGMADDMPDVLKEKIRESYRHRACVERIANLVAGSGVIFESENESEAQAAEDFFEESGLKKIHDNLCRQVKAYGGAYPQLIYTSDILGGSRLSDVFLPDFETVRLGIRSNGKHRFHYYASQWRGLANSRQQYLSPDSYFELDFHDRLDKIVQVPAYDPDSEDVPRGTLSHMVGLKSPIQRYYPTPDYYSASAINIINTAYEISVFDLSDLKNGLNLSYVIEIVREPKEDPNEERKQRDQDRNRVRKQLAGAENNGRAIINWVAPDPEDSKRKGIHVTAIPSGNKADRHKVITQRVKNGILTIHGVTNPKIVAFNQDQGTSGLGNNAEELIHDFELFHWTSIRPLQRPVEEFYNQMLKDAGIEAEARILAAKPVSVKMAENLMTQVLEKNEIREMFGFEPVEEDGQEEEIQEAADPEEEIEENSNE